MEKVQADPLMRRPLVMNRVMIRNLLPPKSQRKELQQLDAILADDSTPQNESVPKSNGETVDKQEVLSKIVVSDGHLNAPLSHIMIRRKVDGDRYSIFR